MYDAQIQWEIDFMCSQLFDQFRIASRAKSRLSNKTN